MKPDDPECIIEIGESNDGSGIECVQTLLGSCKAVSDLLKIKWSSIKVDNNSCARLSYKMAHQASCASKRAKSFPRNSIIDL